MKRKATPKKTGVAPVRVLGSEKTRSGREIWSFVGSGERFTIVTSSSSATAMNEAVVRYGDALKRLAKK